MGKFLVTSPNMARGWLGLMFLRGAVWAFYTGEKPAFINLIKSNYNKKCKLRARQETNFGGQLISSVKLHNYYYITLPFI